MVCSRRLVVANQPTASGAVVDLYEQQLSPFSRRFTLVRRASPSDAVALDIVLALFAAVLLAPAASQTLWLRSASNSEDTTRSAADGMVAAVASRDGDTTTTGASGDTRVRSSYFPPSNATSTQTAALPPPPSRSTSWSTSLVVAVCLIAILAVRGYLRGTRVREEAITVVQGVGIQRATSTGGSALSDVVLFFRSLAHSVQRPPKSPSVGSPTLDFPSTGPHGALGGDGDLSEPIVGGTYVPTGPLLDAGSIQALLMHEGYFRHGVIYYLAAVLRDSPQVVVLFEETLPRLAVLKPVLLGLRHVLFHEKESGASLADIAAKGGVVAATSPTTSSSSPATSSLSTVAAATATRGDHTAE